MKHPIQFEESSPKLAVEVGSMASFIIIVFQEKLYEIQNTKSIESCTCP